MGEHAVGRPGLVTLATITGVVAACVGALAVALLP